ncbi:putative ABC transporter permease [Candidatus Soleaferrea massiliensis]|uniref:putative ABC transporter permease n=1 Tax=Candidatus Soleaferrea massiliensis TaxID=1470354 RepID=UPI00058D1CA8|nr:putative ABC transporter permease [Candidatus Soleaferrea massiliensis]
MHLKSEKTSCPHRPFASGLSFYKLFWIFLIGCILGVYIEIFWQFLKTYQIENRTALVWGPFNPVYGFGAVALTLVLHRFMDKRWYWIFLASAVVGGAFEYLCSVVQEYVFGTVSWEYSEVPFNINGRTHLSVSILWGVLGVWWIKWCYPRLSRLIERIPARVGVPATWVLVVFMVVNITVSALAVGRMTQRHHGVPATNPVSSFLDRQYSDDFMEKVYPNMFFADETRPQKVREH